MTGPSNDMPRANQWRVCNYDNCPELAQGSNWCDAHRPAPWTGSTWQAHKPQGWAKTRANILRRDHNVCVYCGDAATEVDHIIPVSRGGSHDATNLVASCHNCNAKKNIEQRRRP